MKCQKDLFSLSDDHHYLNCAYFSPLLKSVEEAGIAGIKEKRTPWTVGSNDFFEQSNRLRRRFADLVNAPDADGIAILPSASYGLSTVAKNLPRDGSKKIIVAGEQFPSNVYPWMRFCEETGAQLQAVSAPDTMDGRGKEWNNRLLESIDPNTLMVALGNIHWTDGTLFDLEAIGRRAREVGALLVIDGTQSVGALPFDISQIQPDALICAGYKWLMGPYSIALGYFGERFRKGLPLEEGWIERKGSEDFAGLVQYADDYQPGSIRFDVGERSNFILVPMMIRALEQLLEWKPSEIQDYCKELTKDLAAELPTLGYHLEQPERRSHHLFGIHLPKKVDPKRVQRKLSENNVHVSVRGSAIRISPNVYNDKSDITALLKILRNI